MLKESFTSEVTTERLQLRRFGSDDADSVYRNWAGDPDDQLNYGEPVYKTKEDVSGLLDQYICKYDQPYYFRWAIIEKSSGECIGQIAYFLVDAKNEFAEIEYCIGVPYQGKGYATEACREIIRYGFDRIGLHKVQICCRTTNLKSKRVIEKCGFTYEGTLRDYFKMNENDFEGRMYYSILQDEAGRS